MSFNVQLPVATFTGFTGYTGYTGYTFTGYTGYTGYTGHTYTGYTFTGYTGYTGGSRGGSPLFLDQTEAWRAEKNFLRLPPLLSQGLDDPPPPPLSESLYNLYMYVHFYINRFYRVERNIRMHTIFFKNFLTNTHPLSCCSMVRLLHICTWESLKMQRVCFRML